MRELFDVVHEGEELPLNAFAMLSSIGSMLTKRGSKISPAGR